MTTPADIAAAYDDEQRAVIAEAMKSCTDEPDVQYRLSGDLRMKGQQPFVTFGGFIAYAVTASVIEDTDDTVEFCPAVNSDGKFVFQAPEEGESGVMHLMRVRRQAGKNIDDPQWMTIFKRCRWLYAEELDMTSGEIFDRIAAEVDAGETPLTGLSSRHGRG